MELQDIRNAKKFIMSFDILTMSTPKLPQMIKEILDVIYQYESILFKPYYLGKTSKILMQCYYEEKKLTIEEYTFAKKVSHIVHVYSGMSVGLELTYELIELVYIINFMEFKKIWNVCNR